MRPADRRLRQGGLALVARCAAAAGRGAPFSMSKYSWIVTRDTILGDTSDAVGKVGPSGAENRARFDKIIIHGEHFRLLNADGQVQFTGYILGEYAGTEPLLDYGNANGCTAIEYELEGEWVPPERLPRASGGG